VTGRRARDAGGPAARSRTRSERGSALVEVTWLSILLLVPLLFVVLAVFEVQRSAFAVEAATRTAGRAYSLAPSQGEAAGRARVAAAVAMADQGLDGAAGSMVLTCDPDPRACLTPGSVVRVRMTYQVDLPLMPDALGSDTPSIRVAAEHLVPYGSFREVRP
jgi:Flp pilus assembly protein TadG